MLGKVIQINDSEDFKKSLFQSNYRSKLIYILNDFKIL